MKTPKKIIFGVLIFLFVSSLTRDWKNFKAGFFGRPPITEVTK